MIQEKIGRVFCQRRQGKFNYRTSLKLFSQCHIFHLKCTKFNFSRELTALHQIGYLDLEKMDGKVLVLLCFVDFVLICFYCYHLYGEMKLCKGRRERKRRRGREGRGRVRGMGQGEGIEGEEEGRGNGRKGGYRKGEFAP